MYRTRSSRPESLRAVVLGLTVIAAGVVALSPTSACAQFSDAQLKCRSDISKNVGKLAKTIGKTVTGCHKSRLKGKVAAINDCSDLGAPETDPKDKVGKAEAKLIDKVSGPKSKCSGQTPIGLRYTSCPVPCDAIVSSLSTMADLADCLICVAENEVTTILTSSQGAPTPPAAKDDAKCHATIGKEQTKLFSTVLKERSKCQDAAEKGGATDVSACAGLDPSGKIAAARGKGEGKISKSCSAADLIAVDSCATTTPGDVSQCAFDDADTAGDAVFNSIYLSSDPTWATVKAIFDFSDGGIECSSGLCHGNQPGGGNLGDLGDFDLGYDELLLENVFCVGSSFTARVVPGDVANSFLVAKLENTHDCGTTMPQGQPLLDQSLIDVIKVWIQNGAPKN